MYIEINERIESLIKAIQEYCALEMGEIISDAVDETARRTG